MGRTTRNVAALATLALATFADRTWGQPGGPGMPRREGFQGPFGGGGFGGPGGGAFGGPFGGPGGGAFGGPFGGPGGGAFGAPGGGPFGSPDAFLNRLDANRNGMIDPAEAQGPARFLIQRWMPDADLSRPIAIDQLRRAMEQSRRTTPSVPPVPGFGSVPARAAGPGFSAPAPRDSPRTQNTGPDAPPTEPGERRREQRGQQGSAPSAGGPGSSPAQKPGAKEAEKAVGRASLRFRTAQERLPPGLPPWFLQRDRNRDGQVTMAEYGSRWTEALVAEFNQFDANRDGIITPKECLGATRVSTGGARPPGPPPESGTRAGESGPPPGPQPADSGQDVEIDGDGSER